MQIKRNFLTSLLFCYTTVIFGQLSWVLPLNKSNVAIGNDDKLYFTVDKSSCIYFKPDGSRVEVKQNVKRALGNNFFLIEKDTFLGIFDAEKGIVIPPAYEKIEYIGSRFFEVYNYGASAILNADNKVLINYHFRPTMPVIRSADTLLVKFSMHPDAKAQGFLKDGTPLDEATATARYPKRGENISTAVAKSTNPPLPSVFRENGKVGLKSVEGQIILPAEYDEIKNGFPTYFAVRKNGEWGLLKI